MAGEADGAWESLLFLRYMSVRYQTEAKAMGPEGHDHWVAGETALCYNKPPKNLSPRDQATSSVLVVQKWVEVLRQNNNYFGVRQLDRGGTMTTG